MCTQSCRTFLWGGRGIPTYDEGGRCFCVCQDDSWSDLNLLGRASCVPVKAHVIYGWVGVVLSVAALCHASYQLHRQLRFNAQLLAPWTTCAEQCRRSLHVASVIVAVLSLFYFAMVLEDALWWSVFMLAIVQFPVNVSCSFFATRMWIYAIDPRLMRRSPEVLAISSRMERPKGRRAACCFLWIPPGVGLILDLAGLSHYAMKAIAVGIVFQAVAIAVTFWVGGRSLMGAINESLRQYHQQRQETATALTAATAATGATGEDGGDENEQEGRADGAAAASLAPAAGDQSLLAAKTKIKRMMIFALQTVVMVVSMLLVTIFTDYGVAVPLPLFMVPVTFVPLIWDIVNVQLHAGRSKIRSGPQRVLLASAISGRYRRSSQFLGRSLSRRVSSVYLAFSGNQQVVPTEQQPAGQAHPAE